MLERVTQRERDQEFLKYKPILHFILLIYKNNILIFNKDSYLLDIQKSA